VIGIRNRKPDPA